MTDENEVLDEIQETTECPPAQEATDTPSVEESTDCKQVDSSTNQEEHEEKGEKEESNDKEEIDEEDEKNQKVHTNVVDYDAPEQMRKLFVGGVNYRTEEETLKEYFGKYGEIVDCVIMRDPNGRSRGFAFVTFGSIDCVDDCMKNRPHVIDGRDLDVRRATPKEEASKPGGQLSVRKLFIGGCRDGVSEEDLKEYFSKYGNVTDCVVMKDSDGKFRGFGFVTFDDYDPVDKVTLEKNHVIKGHSLDVKKAMPKRKSTSSPYSGSGSRFVDHGPGGWYDSIDGFGGGGSGPVYGSRSSGYSGRYYGSSSSGSPYHTGSMRVRRSYNDRQF